MTIRNRSRPGPAEIIGALADVAQQGGLPSWGCTPVTIMKLEKIIERDETICGAFYNPVTRTFCLFTLHNRAAKLMPCGQLSVASLAQYSIRTGLIYKSATDISARYPSGAA